jgi:hypothetical protein
MGKVLLDDPDVKIDEDGSEIERLVNKGYERVNDFNPWTYGPFGPMLVDDEEVMERLRAKYPKVEIRTVAIPHEPVDDVWPDDNYIYAVLVS